MAGCFFFVTEYNSSLSSFVLNFRILTQVVAEKSLTEKKSLQTDKQTKQTNTITEKAKTIYRLYTSYRGSTITEKAKTIYPLYTSYKGVGGV